MKGPFDLNFVFFVLYYATPVCPIISNKYMTFYIPEYSRRYIYLEGKYSYSLQLVLHKGDPAHSYWGGGTSPANLSTSTSPLEPVEFIIKAPEYAYYGIMAIVQRIHFRTQDNRSGHSSTTTTTPTGCRDYIQFFPEGKGSSSIPPSPKLCGTLPRGNVDWSLPSHLLNGPRSYFNPKGNIRLRVHVDSNTMSHQDGDDLNGVGAEIVFTGYTTCPGTEVGLQTLRPCITSLSTSPSASSTNHRLACIPSSLFCDSKIDCGFRDDFGLDEGPSCYFPYIYGAAAFLILLIILLLIYGFIHWVRVKTKRSQVNQAATAGPSTSEEDQGADPGMAMTCDMDASMGAF